MLKIIAIAAGAYCRGVLGFAATKPDTFQVERRQIKAPPEKIFPLINDFSAGPPGRPRRRRTRR